MIYLIKFNIRDKIIISIIMKRLAVLVRCQQMLIDSSIRGPKKKGQVEAKIQSNDIINIFKDRPDPEPRDIKQYPIFVQQMSLGMSSIHELLVANQQRITHRAPMKPTYKSFLRGIKRQRFKGMREFKQLDSLAIEKMGDFEISDRTSAYDLFSKSEEEEEEQRKAQQAAEAAEEDDDDDI